MAAITAAASASRPSCPVGLIRLPASLRIVLPDAADAESSKGMSDAEAVAWPDLRSRTLDSPLRELTKGSPRKGAPIVWWSDHYQTAMDALKDGLIKVTTNHKVVPFRPFVLDTDSSEFTVGCCLLQEFQAPYSHDLEADSRCAREPAAPRRVRKLQAFKNSAAIFSSRARASRYCPLSYLFPELRRRFSSLGPHRPRITQAPPHPARSRPSSAALVGHPRPLSGQDRLSTWSPQPYRRGALKTPAKLEPHFRRRIRRRASMVAVSVFAKGQNLGAAKN